MISCESGENSHAEFRPLSPNEQLREMYTRTSDPLIPISKKMDAIRTRPTRSPRNIRNKITDPSPSMELCRSDSLAWCFSVELPSECYGCCWGRSDCDSIGETLQSCFPLPGWIEQIPTKVGVSADLRVKDDIQGPLTFGWLKPRVLVPPEFPNQVKNSGAIVAIASRPSARLATVDDDASLFGR